MNDPEDTAEQPQFTQEELEFVEWLEKSLGRKMTPQEINLAIEQAKSVGLL
jgi:hypothetical protein